MKPLEFAWERRLRAAALTAGLMALSGSTSAHSHWPGVFVGTVSAIECKAGSCSARIQIERVMHSPSQSDEPRTGFATVDFAATPTTALAVKDRVWFGGAADILPDGPYMAANVVIKDRTPPPSSSMLGLVFPACGGPPPWTQRDLERCYDPRASSRAVTITGTLLGPPFNGRDVLLVEIRSVRAGRAELAPLSNPALVSVPLAAFRGSTVLRPKVAALGAGDEVMLDAAYVMPEPMSDALGKTHTHTPPARNWPYLGASTITLLKAAKSGPNGPLPSRSK